MTINTNLAVLFPGQGSQSVGMLNDLLHGFPAMEALLRRASDILGYDLSQLIREGPEAELSRTEKTQPALLVAGVLSWEIYKQHSDILPAFFAGHSLGEYTALVCSNVICFDDGIRLVSERGRCMQNAVPAGTGAMAAILGLDGDVIEGVCKQSADKGVVSIANFNAPGQTVIAGHEAAVRAAIDACKQAGAKRAVVLPVSVPSHCELMRDAARQFSGSLDSIVFSDGNIPIVQNIDAIARTRAVDIKPMLLQQLYSPVQWVDSIACLSKHKVSTLIECGPGSVLRGLVKRIDRSLRTLSITDTAGLEQTIDAVTGLERNDGRPVH